MATLFSDFLTTLHVKHTEDYSDKRFFSMPFQTLFGLSKLLEEYGVQTKGVKADDKNVITKLPVPFLADTPKGFAIVTSVTPTSVNYLSQSHAETATLAEFQQAWNGVALLAAPGAKAQEPDYGKHHALEVIDKLKRIGLWALLLALLVYLFIANGLWSSWSAYLLAAFDIAGIYVSYMLVQKSLNIKNARADAVCSVLEEGGCDTIAKSQASSFMGIVKWSEVGLAYFSVSLIALLVFPSYLVPWLALINACCLPYTVWSITYQKFIAKTWCTLCVTVQALLWALFFCYLFGGWWCGPWRFSWTLPVLVGCYGIVLLAINIFDQGLAKLLHPNNNFVNNDTADHI